MNLYYIMNANSDVPLSNGYSSLNEAQDTIFQSIMEDGENSWCIGADYISLMDEEGNEISNHDSLLDDALSEKEARDKEDARWGSYSDQVKSQYNGGL